MQNKNRFKEGDLINAFEVATLHKARYCPCTVIKCTPYFVECKDAEGDIWQFHWDRWRIEKAC